MTNSAVSTIEKTTEIKPEKHPIKNKPFFAIPRHIALIPGLSDRLFRLMSVLCSAYGDDGHIEFKIKTLAALLQKGDRQTRDLIKEGKAKGFFTTKETGRSLLFFLSEICFEGGPKAVRKPAGQVGGNPPTSNHLEKKPEKDEELSNQPPLSGADLVCFLLPPAQRRTVPKRLVNCVGHHIPDNEIPKLIRTAFEKPDPCGYLWGAVRKKQKTDSKKRQCQTPPASWQAPPAKGQNGAADKEIKIPLNEYDRLQLISRYRDSFLISLGRGSDEFFRFLDFSDDELLASEKFIGYLSCKET